MKELTHTEMDMVELDKSEIEQVDGGFVCGGLCVLGGISAGIGFLVAGITVGEKLNEATQ
ncbi:hypothetical protein [Saccharospirillum salsuginis]|uniref:Class IIb bacteriocin, lactobin A/cerein 7B family n=1 Tax=Saccharospirillum salsuginis TaxID=418750 RepID=A0A918NCA6_9GAMM|nr:hypothetical protein [Saccharospirillum salsuginis]GGX57843.1 hypothetical protein GCM10007392_26880 [Saccharospirillum salsuginis]